MDQRKIARFIVVSVFLFSVAFLTFAAYHFYKHQKMVDAINERGQDVVGVIVDKSKSSGSGSSSTSYVIEVEYEFKNQVYINPYSVDSSWWNRLQPNDQVGIVLDPQKPRHSILGEFEGEQITSTGFIPLDE